MFQVPEPVISWCRRINAMPQFHNVVLVVIVATAVLMGIETNAALVENNRQFFMTLNAIVQVIFITEIIIRLLAHAPGMHRFFRDGWNVFDFTVVVLSLMPAAGPFAMVARLARLLRVARLLSVIPELRLLVETMLRSIPSMGSIFLLLGLILYIYAVTGVHLFGQTDPENWGNLGAALITLFEVLTLEGWVELMNTGAENKPWAWVFYVSFIVLAVFVVVNLFIAVVINNLEGAKKAHQAALEKRDPVLVSIREIREKLDAIERQHGG